MTQYEVFEKLLEKKGVSVYRVSQETGISPQTLSQWKRRNSNMSVNNLKKIANYFNADLSVFWSEEEEEVSGKYYISEETAKVAQEISDNKELKLLFDAARSSSPEDLQTVRTMLLALKRKENGGINDN